MLSWQSLNIVIVLLMFSVAPIAANDVAPSKVIPVCNGMKSKELSSLLRSRILLVQDMAMHVEAAHSCDLSLVDFTPNYMEAFGFPSCKPHNEMSRVFKKLISSMESASNEGNLGSKSFVLLGNDELSALSKTMINISNGCDGLLSAIENYLEEK